MSNPLHSIRSRLLVSYLGVCAVGTVILFLAVRLTAPNFFDQHIGGMQGMQAMQSPGGMMSLEAGQLDSALTRSVNEGFLLATAVALPLGVIASLIVSDQIATPIKRLASASGRIAKGEYRERVPAGGPAEIDALASSFNAMAATLERVEQRRVELIGDVAHELRTPVTALRGYVEGLADGVFTPSPETWSKLGEETARLNRLVEDLQELSRAEAGQFSLTTAPVQALEVVRAAVGRLEQSFAETGLVLEVDVRAGLPPVHADFDRVVQVLTNLLTNALKYTPPPGRVAVSVTREANQLCFRVRDSGLGIAPDHLPHLFERFYRVDRSRARRSGGSGVGLTIARALAQAMGGTLTADSQGPGQGSTFTLRLPLARSS